jgi:hypothetical protein
MKGGSALFATHLCRFGFYACLHQVTEYLSWPNVVNMLGDHDCSACNVANVLIPFDDDPKVGR